MKNQDIPLRECEFGSEMQPAQWEVELIEKRGLTDASWHNDICVSFETKPLWTMPCAQRIYRVWVDSTDPYYREMCGPRFSVQEYTEDMEPTTNLYEGDSLIDALDSIPPVINTSNWDK